MADPTALVTALQNYIADKDRREFIIKSSEALVPYGLGALNRSTGLVEFMDDADDLVPSGLILGSSDGDVDHLTGDGSTYKAVLRGGLVSENVSVTGVSAVTDLGKLVYATDGQTMTLTRPTTGLPVGVIVNYRTSTYCDIYLFSFAESVMWSMQGVAPSGYYLKDLGSYGLNAFQGTVALTSWIETSYDHYKIVSWHAQPTHYDNAVVAGAQVLNLEIGGTTVKTTGGTNASALTLGLASFDAAGDMGTAIDASAVVSANEVHVGDVLEVVLTASGTGFTADTAAGVKIYAVCERLPGA
jgi:hypothetical protein